MYSNRISIGDGDRNEKQHICLRISDLIQSNIGIRMSPDPEAGDPEGGPAGRELLDAAVHAGRGHVQDLEVGTSEGRGGHLQRRYRDLLQEFACTRVDFQ